MGCWRLGLIGTKEIELLKFSFYSWQKVRRVFKVLNILNRTHKYHCVRERENSEIYLLKLYLVVHCLEHRVIENSHDFLGG